MIGDIYSYNGWWGYVIDEDNNSCPTLLMSIGVDDVYVGPSYSNTKCEMPTWNQAMERDSYFREYGWHLPTKEELEQFLKVRDIVADRAKSILIDNVSMVRDKNGTRWTSYFMWSSTEDNNSAYILYSCDNEVKKNPKDLSKRKYNGRIRAFCSIEDHSKLICVSESDIFNYARQIRKEVQNIEEQERERERLYEIEYRITKEKHRIVKELTCGQFPKTVPLPLTAEKIEALAKDRISKGYKASLSPNAFQDSNWVTNCYFPCCPKYGCDINKYFDYLSPGFILVRNQYTTNCVIEAKKVSDNSFLVKCEITGNLRFKYGYIKIELRDNHFVHSIGKLKEWNSIK